MNVKQVTAADDEGAQTQGEELGSVNAEVEHQMDDPDADMTAAAALEVCSMAHALLLQHKVLVLA